MYRALDAHIVTLLALYQLYFDELAIKNPDIGNSLKEIARSLGEAYDNDISRSPQEIRSGLLEAVSDPVRRETIKQIQNRLSEYEGSPNKMQKFVMSYLKQFQTILLFVRATRQNDFPLHLAATESLMKYFFAHDHQNYARLLSLYLASMQHTEQHHPEIWQEFMNGKFGITSGSVPFTTRSPDHGIEHENRKLKVIGGIVGLTQNDIALDRFFMIAPEISRLCDEFEKRYNVSRNSIRTQHHEIWGSKLHTTLLNAAKMKDVLASHGNPFDANETELHTLLTNKVMTEKEANDILNRDIIGQQCFETFVHKRLNEGAICVWDRMTKVKLKTFKSSNVSKAVSIGDKVMKVKEERSLLQRFIIAARSRPELDLKECIGGYEFGIVPRSLFASDGTLLLPYNKAKVLHQLELIGSEDTGETCHGYIQLSNASRCVSATARMIIIIDGMAMVHTIKKTSTMSTCKDFAFAFICKLIEIVKPFDEVRLVFDRYLEHSMKEKMRRKRTGGNTTYYHIKDNTLIRNISLSSFLGHNKTKSELTEYLAEKTLHEAVSSNSLKKFMVTAGTTTRGNVDIPYVLQTHSQEEADTIMILHASTIHKDAEVVVYSPDTDVLLLLIQLHTSLPSNISLFTGKGKATRKIPIKPICEKLGDIRAGAILPWHVFTGSDVTGRFAGKSKDWCFKVFLDCDELILKALSSLCYTDEQPTQLTVSELERFVCLLYKSQVYSDVGALRWSMYAHKQALADQLPPTKGSLIPMIQRAHYVTRVLMRSTESHPVLPSPVDHGWFMQPDGTLIPKMCNDPPAPEVILKLIKCGCKKGCKSAYCPCLGKRMCCTELCGCADFECYNILLERPTDFDSESE